ncbi:MAG: UDP-3-O-(3-hydroxymyristoyl)glucosamine N-acyltransferase [Elusimicrobia bacterium]|nr:UDP-3-O-(3-hydroxymyristoyl)glucosamine N-acyltransferase [Elusimicrobiota bacterium]
MKLTAEAVAKLTGGELRGAGISAEITGAAPLDKAGPKDLSFLADAKYAELAGRSNAGCLLASPTAAETLKNFQGTLILVNNPKLAFSLALAALEKELRPLKARVCHPSAIISITARLGKDIYIGPLTVIEDGAVIGDRAYIDAQCFVGAKAKIGSDARLYPGVKVLDGCEIGERSILHSGAVAGSDGYGYTPDGGLHKKIPQIGRVIIGSDVEIGANTAIDRAALEATIIGDGTKIDNLVHIAHNVRVGKNCLVLAQAGIAGSAVIGDNAVLAGQAAVSDHITIGDNTVVMGKTAVISDLGPNQIVFGHVARPHLQAMKIEALLSKLPEMHAAIRKIKKHLGITDVSKNDQK